MSAIAASFMLASVATFAISAWYLVCNDRTYCDRVRMIEAQRKYSGSDTFWALHKQYCLVSYTDHLWARLLFRDPMKLYGMMMRDVLEGRDP